MALFGSNTHWEKTHTISPEYARWLQDQIVSGGLQGTIMGGTSIAPPPLTQAVMAHTNGVMYGSGNMYYGSDHAPDDAALKYLRDRIKWVLGEATLGRFSFALVCRNGPGEFATMIAAKDGKIQVFESTNGEFANDAMLQKIALLLG